MKKILLAIWVITLFSGCFIFKKKEKYGCPVNGSSIGAEKIAAEDPGALKASKKSKFKGVQSY